MMKKKELLIIAILLGVVNMNAQHLLLMPYPHGQSLSANHPENVLLKYSSQFTYMETGSFEYEIRGLSFDYSSMTLTLCETRDPTPEEAKVHPRRNYITRAMGVEETVKVDAGIKTYKGQKILICSDGLHGKVDDDEILAKVSKPDAKKSVKSLVKLANDRGGEDNISVVIMEGEESDA